MAELNIGTLIGELSRQYGIRLDGSAGDRPRRKHTEQLQPIELK